MIKQAIIIDDNEEICAMLATEINKAFNLKIQTFLSAEAFLNQNDNTQAIYLVDMNLPGKDGDAVIRAIRQFDKLSPIFMISADQTNESIQRGLAAGADDYLIKPFQIQHMLMKVRNACMKMSALKENFISDKISIHPEGSLVIRGNTKLSFTSREFEAFACLYENQGKSLTRQEIINSIKDPISERNVDQLIYRLRMLLPKIDMEIQSKYGKGYMLIVKD